MKVVAVGDFISLFVNGEYIAKLKDASSTSGALGFFIQNDSKADATVTYDNVKLTSLVLP